MQVFPTFALYNDRNENIVKHYTDTDEQQLAEQLRCGNAAAMRVFYDRYGGLLTAVCARYITDSESLKDVMQDSMVQLLTHVSDFKYRGEGSLRAWATKIVVTQALRYLREETRREWQTIDWDVADVPEEDDPPVNDIPPDVIQQMVRRLPTGYRTVFNLYVFEHKSHQEIAQLLGIKKDSSASQLSRAKNLLAQMIRQYTNTQQ